jgi:hypothetical protein
MCAWINNGQLSDKLMQILRMGRLVAVPKPDGGIRPIVISSFFLKLTGACVLEMAKMRCASSQFAINKARGAERIVHLTRQSYAAGRAILRIDSSNAFNVTPRANIARALVNAPNELKRYFNTVYVPSAQLIVYGPNKTHAKIASDEGVRQGDAASALLFCLVMDEACRRIKEAHPGADVWCFMDDITVACEPSDAANVLLTTARTLLDLGFKVNVAKSAVAVSSQPIADAVAHTMHNNNMGVRLLGPDEEFTMLGACINGACDRFLESKGEQLRCFFDKLLRCHLHPQLAWTILRLCGAPKMIYLACTMNQPRALALLQHFDNCIKTAADKILDADVPAKFLHSSLGAGFPCYSAVANDLFNNSRDMSLSNAATGVEVKLVLDSSSLPQTADLRSQASDFFQFFSDATRFSSMTPKQFTMAMSIKLRTLPRGMQVPRRCSCGTHMPTSADFIEHTLKCDSMSRYTKTHRHNEVRDAIAAVARSYGFAVTKEPTFYVYNDADGVMRRPDITVFTPTPIATDVTIVYPQLMEGHASGQAAAEKVKTHARAVEGLGHRFIPFAMETFGFKDEKCFTFISEIAKDLPTHLQRAFRFDMHHAVSASLAKARATSIIVASHQVDDAAP